MNDFLQTALTFPTLLWSVLFAVCVAYWLLAATGLFHHGDGGSGHGFDTDHGHVGDEVGVLARLGLDGVPLMVMLTLLSFVCWVVTYFVHLLLLSRLPSAAQILPGLLVAIGALVPGVLLTSLLLKPLRQVFTKLNPPELHSLVGSVGYVTTPTVDARAGMASVNDGGAGLLLQVRAQPPSQFVRGERVVLLSYNPADNTYLVTSEDHFNA